MEFVEGDTNEFIDMIYGHKSTISADLGTVTMFVGFFLIFQALLTFHETDIRLKVSQKIIQGYNQMIQDTPYNFRSIYNWVMKIACFTTDNASIMDSSVNLKDE